MSSTSTKLLISALLFLVLFGSIAFASDINYTCDNYADGSSRIRGDIDGDGSITTADVNLAQEMANGNIAIPFEKCCAYLPTSANPDPNILVSVSAIQYLADGNWIDAGTCASPKQPVCVTCCALEGQTIPVVPGRSCCPGLSAIPTTVTNLTTGCQPAVGASICTAKCGNGVCDPLENACNCSIDCGTQKVSETVKCNFSGSTTKQGCYSEIANCYGIYDCKTTATAAAGKVLTWKSSCGGEQKTIVDGNSKEITFDCSGVVTPTDVTEQVKCVFNNAADRQKCYSFFGNNVFSCLTGSNGNYNTCVADVTAPKGTRLDWKSSCGGYAYTIVDGSDEYVKFDCAPITPPVCACTREYVPVCGTIKICTTSCDVNSITSNSTTTCQDNCYEQQKTFSNSCEAKCAGVTSISSGTCEQICPETAAPECPNGKIEVFFDERGCEKPRCVAPEAEHFTGAYWQCSNGQTYKETANCMPYSFWKNKARNTCAKSNCVSDTNSSTTAVTSPQTSTSHTGNFILDMVGPILATSSTPANTTSQTTCVNGEVTLTSFYPFGSCTPGSETCKYYIDQDGCKVKSCVNGDQERVCPVDSNTVNTNTYRKAYWQCYSGKESYEGGASSCKTDVLWKQYAQDACKNECSAPTGTCSVDSNTCSTAAVQCGLSVFQLSAPCFDGKPIICSTQTQEEIIAAKEKCYSNNLYGELKVQFDSQGCRTYSCATSTQVCRSINDLPAEKKLSCEERGGQLITKADSNGCLTYIDCIGEKITDSNASIDTNILTDKMKLLDLAIKIETAKIELEKTALKIRGIAKYYEDANKISDANRFYRAANIIEAAALKLDEIKLEIKNNVDDFSEERALAIRDLIRNIKEELLKEALLEMLG